MKKTVVLSPDTTIVDVNKLSYRKYYGFIMSGNSPGFISSSGDYSEDGTYNARFFDGMTGNNTWYTKDFETLKDCVTDLLINGHQVFEFDIYTELFRWAIDGK